MDIQVDTIRISGFRGLQNIEVLLPKVAVLIGTNNSGKTSIIKAFQLALGDYSRYVADEDLFIARDQTRANFILVDVRVIAIDKEGDRIQKFSNEWIEHLGDNIQSEADGKQFLAIRTRSSPNAIKGGFETLRSTLDRWPSLANWTTEKVRESKLGNKKFNIPLIPIDAQRDIHLELRDKSSFIGKVLSNINYDDKDIATLEGIIKTANDEAVAKSPELQNLKKHLEGLSQSFSSSGSAEITPLPKKIRDLSKHFSIHFGESASNSFSMEYHGMGTRSWASMLTVKSFLDMTAEKHASEAEPFLPILAAEEPEAHLHPNAQKTLYSQLADSKRQVIVSTHSPYLAAMCSQENLRHIRRVGDDVHVDMLRADLDDEAKRRLQREVIHSRGELLFSNAIILCEGETEEQALPILFKKYFTHDPFALGITFIGVGGSGKKYLPFLTFAKDFSIPAFIFSDGEAAAIKDLQKHYSNIHPGTDICSDSHITVLEGTDFEGYLLSNGYHDLIEKTILDTDGASFIDDWIKTKDGALLGRKKTNRPPCKECGQPIFEDQLRDYKAEGGLTRAILEILDSNKTRYAPMIAQALCKLDNKDLPPKVIEFFEKIQKGCAAL
ncbi:ATP-dependent nuclease [Pseudomonas sp. S1_A06]